MSQPEHRCLAFHRGFKGEWACACGWWHQAPCPVHAEPGPGWAPKDTVPGPAIERGLWSST